MSNIKNIERLQELLVLVAGTIVMLVIPYMSIARSLQDDLIQYVFFGMVVYIISGDAKKSLMPLLEVIVKATPTKVDDAALAKAKEAMQGKPTAE